MSIALSLLFLPLLGYCQSGHPPKLESVFRPALKGVKESFHSGDYDKKSTVLIRENTVFENYGVFCKMEAIRQRKHRIPVFLRVGAKEYVDYLDGHNPAYLLRGK